MFLTVAVLAGTTKGYCGKKTGGYTKGFRDAILTNILRMLLCILIGFVLILLDGGISQLAPSLELCLISALSGVSTAAFVVTWLISVRKSAYMMLDIFLMLGILVPLILSNVFFHESIKQTQWVGIVLLFVAVVLMCSYNNSIKTKITVPSFVILIICGIASGVADFSQKLFVNRIEGVSVAVFNFYTYLFVALVLMLAFIVAPREKQNANADDYKKMSCFILIMAIFLFLNSYFKTLAAEHLRAVLLYPLNQGCGLILSAAMSAALFREKLTAKAVLGILISFAGLVIINAL